MVERLRPALARFDQAEVALCRSLNKVGRQLLLRDLLRAVSRLGDGILWYVLLICFPLLYGSAGIWASLHMGLVALAGVATYKFLKNRAVRERPYITHDAIDCVGAPLDRYSFPSGHTMHAVAFTLLASHYFPEWALPLVCFGTLVALSRVALGLHYPTDVAAGAALGGALAAISLWATYAVSTTLL